MDIVVAVKMVPDLVEELVIDAGGTDLDRSLLTPRVNEFDEHALEEAVLLKERHGGTVTVLAVDTGDVDETLFTCLARGADRAVKLTGDFAPGLPSRTMAAVLAEAIRALPHDLVLAGVQAADDRDGQVGVLLAGALGLPHVSVVSGVELAGPGMITARQEYGAGLMAEFEIDLPCVLGIQAAREAPRYAPVSKVRQLMKTARLEEVPAAAVEASPGSRVRRLLKPEEGAGAEMLDGAPEEVAERLVAILRERGVVKA